MLNHIVIMGRLVRDPELRHTQTGIPVCTFRIAVDRNYTTQNGERETDFISATAWRGTAEFISKYFSKGRMITVDGRLETQDWVDRDGNRRVSTGIVAESVYFADSRRNDAQEAVPQSAPQSAQEGAPASDRNSRVA